jgi:acetyltransferase-like isoleucine patch superfamily enzyme
MTCGQIKRFCTRIRTFLLWKPRLYALGGRTTLSRPLYCNNPRAVSIGSGVLLSRQFVLADLKVGEGWLPKIAIGDGCTIMYRFQCNAAASVRIGRNVLIASNVLITDSDHVIEPGGIPVTRNEKLVTSPVVVEDNCWIGQNVVILKGVVIGHDSVVGANSVVTRSVPALSIVAGSPARIIGAVDRKGQTVDHKSDLPAEADIHDSVVNKADASSSLLTSP